MVLFENWYRIFSFDQEGDEENPFAGPARQARRAVHTHTLTHTHTHTHTGTGISPPGNKAVLGHVIPNKNISLLSLSSENPSILVVPQPGSSSAASGKFKTHKSVPSRSEKSVVRRTVEDSGSINKTIIQNLPAKASSTRANFSSANSSLPYFC